jgi:hypothetical protein
MSSGTIIALELGITLVAVLGWGFWELWQMKKGK